MSEINRTSLFGKLNQVGYRAIEGATVFCKLRGNPYVELVHWMQQIVQAPDSDLHKIVRHFQIDAGILATDITTARPEAVATGMRATFAVAAILIVVALAIAVGSRALATRHALHGDVL